MYRAGPSGRRAPPRCILSKRAINRIAIIITINRIAIITTINKKENRIAILCLSKSAQSIGPRCINGAVSKEYRIIVYSIIRIFFAKRAINRIAIIIITTINRIAIITTIIDLLFVYSIILYKGPRPRRLAGTTPQPRRMGI